MTDELLDADRHAEEVLEDRSQSFGVARVTDQRADVEELGEVGQRVASAKRVRRQADERTNVRRRTGRRPDDRD